MDEAWEGKVTCGKWTEGLPRILFQLVMKLRVADATFLFDYGRQMWAPSATTKQHPLRPSQDGWDGDLI